MHTRSHKHLNKMMLETKLITVFPEIRPSVNQDVMNSPVFINQQTLTGLKKSPIHLAMIRDNMIGMPKVMSPVHSITITVKLIVIRTVPPNWQAAPTRMYLTISVP